MDKFKKSIEGWIKDNSEKELLDENKNGYKFKYCNIKYFIEDIDNTAHIEYTRYLEWNKLIKKIKGFFIRNKISFKRKSLDSGIGNNMAMWVARNLLQDHYLVDPFIPYNAKYNKVLEDTFFKNITKKKGSRLNKKQKDKFFLELINDCNSIIQRLYEEKKNIISDPSNKLKILYVNKEEQSYFNVIYKGKDKPIITCDKKIYDNLKRKYLNDNRPHNSEEDNIDELIFSIIIRYKTLMGESHQFAMKPLFKDALKKKYNVQMELFGSAINSYYDMYCSLFWDLEKHFGSYGNFNLLEMKKGFYIANPPYEENLLGIMVDKFFSTVESKTGEPLAISYGMPNWKDYDFEPLKKSEKNVNENEDKYIVYLTREIFKLNELIGIKYKSFIKDYNNPSIEVIKNKKTKEIFNNK